MMQTLIRKARPYKCAETPIIKAGCDIFCPATYNVVPFELVCSVAGKPAAVSDK